MTIDLFSFVGLFDKQLATAAHLLDKAEAHVGGEEFLDWRLIGDMHPLRFQLRVLVNFTRSWPARVIGEAPPADVADTLDLAGWRAAIADARAYLAGLTHERFAGRDDVPLTVELGNGLSPTLPAGQWLTGFAATNIYFHLSMLYAILRGRGVPIGKTDLFAGGL